MWTFAELKLRARTALSRGFGKSVLAVLLCQILRSISGNLIMANSGMSQQEMTAKIMEDPEFITKMTEAIMNNSGMVAGLVGMLLLLSLVISVFIMTPLTVGENRYFNEVARGNISIKEIFFAFTGGIKNYFNIVKAGFLKTAVLFLWGIIGLVLGFGIETAIILSGGAVVDSLALVVIMMYAVILISVLPMIIKSYQYIMVEYILTDEPDIGARAALKKSKQMTKGCKLRIFLLSLSFIGWYLLGGIAFGIGIFFVLPYVQTTFSELYLVLRGEKKTNAETVEWYSNNCYQED